MKKSNTPKRAFTTTEAAHYLALSDSLLRQSRMNGTREGRIDGPPWVRLGNRKIVYFKEDLDAWLDAQKSVGEKVG